MFINKEGLVRSGWKIALVFTIVFGLVYLEGYLFNYFANLHIEMPGGSEDDMSRAYAALHAKWEWLLFIIKETVIIAVPLIAWKVFSKRKLEDMGLGRFRINKKPFGVGLLFGILSITVVFIVILLTGNGYVETWEPRFTANTLLYVFVFIIVGFAEEILARGYYMSVLRQTKSMPLVVFVSAIMFSLMHMMNNAFNVIPFINITLAGLLFTYMYLKSGSIWMSIGYHITWNYFQGCVYGFPVSGIDSKGIISTQYASDTILNGGAFGPEGGLIVTAVILLGFVFVRWYYRKSKFQFMDMDTPAAIQALHLKIGRDSSDACI